MEEEIGCILGASNFAPLSQMMTQDSIAYFKKNENEFQANALGAFDDLCGSCFPIGCLLGTALYVKTGGCFGNFCFCYCCFWNCCCNYCKQCEKEDGGKYNDPVMVYNPGYTNGNAKW